MPPGFELPWKCWKLNRALYGLRISPKLWQREASKVLTKLGLKVVPEDPCVFVKEGIMAVGIRLLKRPAKQTLSAAC
jgi:hypothetical protein